MWQLVTPLASMPHAWKLFFGFLCGRVMVDILERILRNIVGVEEENMDHATSMVKTGMILVAMSMLYFSSGLDELLGEKKDVTEEVSIQPTTDQAQKKMIPKAKSSREMLADMDKKPSARLSDLQTVQEDNQKPWWNVQPVIYTAEQEIAISALMDKYFGPETPVKTREQIDHYVVNKDRKAACARALTARKWNVDEAIKLLDRMIEWREENGVNTILKEQLPTETLTSIRSCLYDGFYGVCNDGFPIYICFGGKLDLAECTKLVGLDAIIKYHIQVMEYNHKVYYPKISKLIGRTVSKVTMVLDLSGFGAHNVKSAFWNCINALGEVDDKCYFEFLHRVFIVNAGFFFRVFWKTASPMLQEETKNKFKVLSRPSDLLKYIPSQELPKYFGGEAADEGAFCRKDRPWTTHYQDFDTYVRGKSLRIHATSSLKKIPSIKSMEKTMSVERSPSAKSLKSVKSME